MPTQPFSDVRALVVAIASLGILYGAGLVPAHAAMTTEPTANQHASGTVPMRVITSPGNKGMNGIVEIRVGGSRPFAVMLDTGSVGLRVFPGAWSSTPDGVTVTNSPVTAPSDAGSMKGFVARAPFTIGGVTTSSPVAFQFVNTDSQYIAQWARKGVYGILGVGTGRYLLPNPLTALPGIAGHGWAIHFGGDPATRRPGAGVLVLGAQVPPDAAATFALPAAGPNQYGGLLWDDHKARACWTFGRAQQQCVDTLFDSGFDVMRVKGKDFAHLPTRAAGALRAGTAVSMAESGSAATVWRFDAGQTQSLDFVRVLARGSSGINTANALYFQYTVTYDLVRGRISLSRPVPTAPASRAPDPATTLAFAGTSAR